MVLASMRPIGRTLSVLCGGATPQEIALGVALGAVLGLIPKSNLTAVLLCGVILSLRVNLAAAVFAAGAFSGLAPLLDGVAHQLGSAALSLRALQGGWAWLFRQPIVPWLRLDNTLVLGQLFLGLTSAWPIYRLTFRIVSRIQPQLTAAMTRSAIARTVLGVRLPAQRRAA